MPAGSMSVGNGDGEDDGTVDPTREIALRVYGEDGKEDGGMEEWPERIRTLDRESPVVVFSKVSLFPADGVGSPHDITLNESGV